MASELPEMIMYYSVDVLRSTNRSHWRWDLYSVISLILQTVYHRTESKLGHRGVERKMRSNYKCLRSRAILLAPHIQDCHLSMFIHNGKDRSLFEVPTNHTINHQQVTKLFLRTNYWTVAPDEQRIHKQSREYEHKCRMKVRN